MKKIICILLALITLLAFSACTNETDTPAEKSYSLTYNGQTLKIDAKAEESLTALGAPKNYQELPTCGKGDLDKLYDFGSIRVRTYQLNGVDYISVIELMDDLVSTPEGLSIGSTQQKALDTYGEATKKTDLAWIYHATGMDLEIHFNADQTVKSIVYRGEN